MPFREYIIGLSFFLKKTNEIVSLIKPGFFVISFNLPDVILNE